MTALLQRAMHLRDRSLIRGNTLVLLSLPLTFWLSDFPHNRASLLLMLPLLLAVAGTADTVRCLQPRWNFYHGGVLLCLYMDLMVLAMTAFALLYPYAARLAGH